MIGRSVFATLAVAVGLLGAGQACADIIVTGTYNVTRTCKGVTAGDPLSETFTDLPMQITQTGTDLNITFNSFPLNGHLMPIASAPDDKGVASMVSCTINSDLDFSGPNFNRLGRIDFKAKNGEITFKGAYYDEAAIAANFVKLCKIRGTRTSIMDPLVGACPP